MPSPLPLSPALYCVSHTFSLALKKQHAWIHKHTQKTGSVYPLLLILQLLTDFWDGGLHVRSLVEPAHFLFILYFIWTYSNRLSTLICIPPKNNPRIHSCLVWNTNVYMCTLTVCLLVCITLYFYLHFYTVWLFTCVCACPISSVCVFLHVSDKDTLIASLGCECITAPQLFLLWRPLQMCVLTWRAGVRRRLEQGGEKTSTFQ